MLPTWKKALYIISWTPFILVQTALILLGAIFFVPVALLLYGGDSGAWPYWPFHPFGNDDRPAPDWWVKKHHFWSNWWWFAVRNPVSNTHWWFRDRPATFYGTWHAKAMEPRDLLAQGKTKATRWAVNGFFAGYKVVWIVDATHYGEFWIAWKVGSDVPGMGFAMQLRRNREIGA